jgi:hypothetical protein
VVLDNLIARKELPVMAAVFVNPGVSIGQDDALGLQARLSLRYVRRLDFPRGDALALA